MDFWTWVILIDIVVRIAGLLLAADAVMYARTPTGALAWAMGLLIIPELAIVPYQVFGARRFVGYVKARRRGRSAIDSVAADLLQAMKPWVATQNERHPAFDTLERLTGLPATTSNRPALLIDGKQTFPAIFEALAGARAYILAEYYILRDDRIGGRFVQALCDAAARGVKVYLLHAGGGRLGPSLAMVRRLRRAGVMVRPFASRKMLAATLAYFTPLRRRQLNFRNHRKIVVCDGQAALLGGLNVGDEYLGHNPALSPWRDTHLRLSGPSVHAVQLAWLEDWVSATGWAPALDWTPARPGGEHGAPPDGGATVAIVPSGPADTLDTCALMFLELIGRARSRLWISTPYFVPDESIVHALQLAARRAVDVRVIIPGPYDLALPWHSSFTYYDELLPAGVRIFRYQRGFNHQKTMLCDDLAVVGSANVDNRSFRINFEVTAVLEHPAMTRAMEAMFERDLTHCVEATRGEYARRSWWFRLKCSCARLLAPIQ